MPKPTIKKPATKNLFEPEIERLLYIGTVIRSLVKRGAPLLDAREFSKSVDAIAKFSREFDRELEQNLLRAYEQAGRPKFQ